jgi:beta-N-acetylhexosaminidase
LAVGAVLLAACGTTDQAAPMSSGGLLAATVPSAQLAPASSSLAAQPRTAAPTTSVAAVTPLTAPPSSAVVAPPTAAPAPAVPLPPGGLVTDADMAQAAAAVAAMGVPVQAGSVIMANSADAVGTDAITRLHLAGVNLLGAKGIVNGTEGGTPAEVKAVTDALQAQLPADQSGVPLLIGSDQEYGIVTRLVNGFTEFPGADELSGISDTTAAATATQEVTAAAAAEMLAVGINVDFAPDADILPSSGAASGVAGRSFGSDPERVGTLVAAAVKGYQSAGLAATVKHFPGIGRLATDTHTALPSLDIGCEEWNSMESVPMRAGVDAGTALVMTGHVMMPAVGVTDKSSALSSAVVTDLLKGSGVAGCTGLNFHGVAVSDSFVMAPVLDAYGPAEAAWRGLAAGLDIVLMPKDPDAAVAGIVAAVGDGSLAATRLQDAATKVYALRLALARSPHPGLDVVGSDAHETIAANARNQG